MATEAEALRLEINDLMKKARFGDVIALCTPKLDDANPDVVIRALLGLRAANFGIGQFTKAQENVDKAVTLAREQGSPELLVDALNGASSQRVQSGMFDDQLRTLAQEALTLAESQPYPRGIAEASTALSFAEAALGSKAQAFAHLNRAIELSRSMRDRDLEADALGAMANQYYWVGKPNKSLEATKRALALYQQTENELERAVSLSNMSHYQFSNFRNYRSFERALEYAQESLVLARELGYAYGEFAAIEAIGSCYLTSFQPGFATVKFEEALTLVRKFDHRSLEQRTLRSLAYAYAQSKQYDQALTYLKQAYTLFEVDAPALWHMGIRYEMGNVCQKGRRYEDALAYWNEALAIERGIPSRKRRYFMNRLLKLVFSPYYRLRILLSRKQPEPTPAG